MQSSFLPAGKVFGHYSLYHHPNSTVEHYEMVCICRKVQPEVLLLDSGGLGGPGSLGGPRVLGGVLSVVELMKF